MRILAILLGLCGIVVLYFGVGMLLVFSGEANSLQATLTKGGLLFLATLLFFASGWLWSKARQLTASFAEDEERPLCIRGVAKRGIAIRVLLGLVVVSLLYIWLLNK